MNCYHGNSTMDSTRCATEQEWVLNWQQTQWLITVTKNKKSMSVEVLVTWELKVVLISHTRRDDVDCMYCIDRLLCTDLYTM